MKVRLNKAHLDDLLTGIFELQIEPIRVAYVSKDEGNTEIGERGLPEYIFVYSLSPPSLLEEPELYAIPHKIDIKQPKEEVWLKYQKATIILISKETDDKFRSENKDLINVIETLYVE